MEKKTNRKDDFSVTIPYLKSKLRDYLIQTGRLKSGEINRNFCCASKDHSDNNPSMRFYEESNTCYCFSCRRRMDIFDMIGDDENITGFVEQYKRAKEFFPLNDSIRAVSPIIPEKSKYKLINPEPTKNYVKFFNYCYAHIKDTDYPAKRGLSLETIKRAKLGYNPSFIVGEGVSWQALVIPTGKDSYVIRNISPDNKGDRYRNSRGGKQLYTAFAEMDNPDKPLIVTEGEIDALSIVEIGGSALALGSVSNTNKLVKYLLDFPDKSKTIVINLDNDSAGRSAAEELSEEIKALGFTVMPGNLNGKYKDINEYLCADRKGLEEEYAAVVKKSSLIIAQKPALAVQYENVGIGHKQSIHENDEVLYEEEIYQR